MNVRPVIRSLTVVFVMALIGWLTVKAVEHRDPSILLTNVDIQRPGTVQFVNGYWIARQPSGDYRVFLDQEPHSGRPLRWYSYEEESHFQWDFLWKGGPFIITVKTPKDHFVSPVWGEMYTIDGSCVGGPCDKRGLYAVPVKEEGKQLKLTSGIAAQVNDKR